MSASELVPEHLDPELALAAQAEDQRLLLVEDLAARRGVRPMAARFQSCLTLGLVAPPPLAQGRPRDAAASTDDPGVAELLVEPDPAEPCARVHASSPPIRLWTCWTTPCAAHNPTAAPASTLTR